MLHNGWSFLQQIRTVNYLFDIRWILYGLSVLL